MRYNLYLLPATAPALNTKCHLYGDSYAVSTEAVRASTGSEREKEVSERICIRLE